MNILLSLLIYNPIEAYTIILLCDVITGNNTKININAIEIIYLFGTINLFFQYIPNFVYGSIFYIVINLFIVFIVYPILVYNIYVNIFHNYTTFKTAIVAVFIENIFVLVISVVIEALFKNESLFFNNDICIEFVSNFIIFSIQISLYTFVKKRGKVYEEYCKGNRKRNDT